MKNIECISLNLIDITLLNKVPFEICQKYKILPLGRFKGKIYVGMEEIKKDLPYYRRSGGGVTLSGGEALCQPDFAAALLQACREYGIHTAMESTGYADFNKIFLKPLFR